MSDAMKFRYDINWLRAVAVIAVVAFHFEPEVIPGGFVGVDVFFVISGYLMTRIICSSYDGGRFSYFKFLSARINRIFPAMALVCLALLFWGWFYLSPQDYKDVGMHVASSVSFLSNFVYWRETGYFDASSLEKWLLHTWSLSVEWQFYVVYPFYLVVLKRFFSSVFVQVYLVTFLLLFALSSYGSFLYPDASYYLLPFRAWEMVAGGVAYIFSYSVGEGAKRWFSMFGISLIVISFFLYDESFPWPSFFALLPVLGAFCVIAANAKTTKLGMNFCIQSIGKWSYSIYLWHWPIVVGGHYFSLPYVSFWGIPLSFLMGFLSYRYIESISWRSSINWLSIVKGKPFLASLAALLLGVGVFFENGFVNRFSEDKIERLSVISSDLIMPYRGNGYCFYSFNKNSTLNVSLENGTECTLGYGGGPNNTLFFGDSYAGHFDPFWDRFFTVHEHAVTSVSTNWCYPSFDITFPGSVTHKSYQQCLLNRNYLKEQIESGDIDNLILAGSWAKLDQGMRSEVLNVVRFALSAGIKVVVMPAPQSFYSNPMPRLERSLLLGTDFEIQDLMSPASESANLAFLESLSDFSGVMFLSSKDLFSPQQVFSLEGVDVPYSLDGGHISLLGSLKAYDYFSGTEAERSLVEFLGFDY